MDSFMYLNESNQPVGPVTGVVLKRLIKKSLISPRTLVWNEALGDWKEAIQVLKRFLSLNVLDYM